MDRTVQALARRYGQSVELLRGEETAQVWAFLRPVTRESGQGEQYRPTPLGLRREDRWLYLGEGPLSPLSDRARWNGTTFEVQSARPVYIGDTLTHWQALLVPEDKETT